MTRRGARQTTLEDTCALLEATLEATQDAILVANLDREVVRYNRRFLEMFNLSAEEIDRRGADAITDAVRAQVENVDELMRNSRELLADPSAPVLEVVRFKDGRVFHRHVAPHRIDGVIAGRVASYREITDSVRATAALEREHEFLETAQAVAHIGSWEWNLVESTSIWSAEMYRLLGVDPDHILNTAELYFTIVHPDDRDMVRRTAEAAMASAGSYDNQHRIVRPDGSVVWIHGRGRTVARDAAGRATKMVGTLQDITDRRRLEEQLRTAQRLEAIGRLAGGVAHDLNNALTTIAGYTELALGQLDDGHPARPDVQEIRRAAERAESVTRQLLAFSRKQLLAPKVFSLGDSVVGIGRVLNRLLGDAIELHTDVAEGLPPVVGDPGQIEQAILNLAVNARDAMPGGGRLALCASAFDADDAFVRAHQPMTPGRYVELSVSDTGEGMTPNVLAHIFEPFFTTKDVGKGTGLGLAMVYGTVQQSGGFIFVDSEEGRGTTFRLYFAAADPGRAAPAPSADPRPGATVLVVEDEATIRHLVVSTLGQAGYRILHAASAQDALAIAAHYADEIDLLLTDANMPGMDGIALAGELVRQRPSLRVVVMSGYTDSDFVVPGISEAVCLLPKPFTPRELRQRVRDVLSAPRA
jgi:PAS domain S-box-containing protein